MTEAETVLQREDDSGEWVDCDAGWYDYQSQGRYSQAKLMLILSDIPAGTEHRLRLRYPDAVDGEAVERFTTPITLTLPENIDELSANANGGFPEGFDIGGDPDEDDFGDQGEQAPSGPIIPAPGAGGGSDDSSGGSDDDSGSDSGGRETEAEPTPESAPQAAAAPYPASEPIPEPTPAAAAATLPQPTAAPVPAPTPTEPDETERQAPPRPKPKPAGKAAGGESVAASQPDKAAAANAKGETQPSEAARPGGPRWAAWIAALPLAGGGAAFALWRRRKGEQP